MRVLLVCACFVFTSVTKAQELISPYFMGSDIVFSNQLNALGILKTDSTSILVESEIQNLYGFKDLNTYKLSIGRMKPKTGFKFSYRYIQENVFVNQHLNFGLQKKLSEKLTSNIMLGANWLIHNNRRIKHIVYGIDLRYRVSPQVILHQQIKTLTAERNRILTESHYGIRYNVSTICGAIAQLDYYGDFDGVLGVSLSIAGINVQATHIFIRNKLGLGIGFNYLNLNFSFTYHYHDILGGESQAKVQIAL